KVYTGENGSIVFLSSVMGTAGSAGTIPYSMSKAALSGIVRPLALELASRCIRVNCIAPGFVQASLFAHTENCGTKVRSRPSMPNIRSASGSRRTLPMTWPSAGRYWALDHRFGDGGRRRHLAH
ncbi:MAG TPA: SDR family oxidoreductase, partial [Sphingomicrobium sp.]